MTRNKLVIVMLLKVYISISARGFFTSCIPNYYIHTLSVSICIIICVDIYE